MIVDQVRQLTRHIGETLGSQLFTNLERYIFLHVREWFNRGGLKLKDIKHMEAKRAFNDTGNLSGLEPKHRLLNLWDQHILTNPAQVTTLARGAAVLGKLFGKRRKVFGRGGSAFGNIFGTRQRFGLCRFIRRCRHFDQNVAHAAAFRLTVARLILFVEAFNIGI